MDKKHAVKCKKNPCTCDTYHTFDELYLHRVTLYIIYCSAIWNDGYHCNIPIWRSKAHSDGSIWDGWFILGIYKEQGRQITYHIPLEFWEMTDFAETLEKAPEYDGHTSDDVLQRLLLI